MATRRGRSVRSGDETPVLPGQLRSAPAGPGRRTAGRWRGHLAPGGRRVRRRRGEGRGREGRGRGPGLRAARPAPPAPARGAPPPPSVPSRRPALLLPAPGRGRRSADSTAAADRRRTAPRPRRRRHPGARGGPGAGRCFHGDRLPARRDYYDTAGRPRPALPGATASFLSPLSRGRTRGGGTRRAECLFPFPFFRWRYGVGFRAIAAPRCGSAPIGAGRPRGASSRRARPRAGAAGRRPRPLWRRVGEHSCEPGPVAARCART